MCGSTDAMARLKVPVKKLSLLHTWEALLHVNCVRDPIPPEINKNLEEDM